MYPPHNVESRFILGLTFKISMGAQTFGSTFGLSIVNKNKKLRIVCTHKLHFSEKNNTYSILLFEHMYVLLCTKKGQST